MYSWSMPASLEAPTICSASDCFTRGSLAPPLRARGCGCPSPATRASATRENRLRSPGRQRSKKGPEQRRHRRAPRSLRKNLPRSPLLPGSPSPERPRSGPRPPGRHASWRPIACTDKPRLAVHCASGSKPQLSRAEGPPCTFSTAGRWLRPPRGGTWRTRGWPSRPGQRTRRVPSGRARSSIVRAGGRRGTGPSARSVVEVVGDWAGVVGETDEPVGVRHVPSGEEEVPVTPSAPWRKPPPGAPS